MVLSKPCYIYFSWDLVLWHLRTFVDVFTFHFHLWKISGDWGKFEYALFLASLTFPNTLYLLWPRSLCMNRFLHPAHCPQAPLMWLTSMHVYFISLDVIFSINLYWTLSPGLGPVVMNSQIATVCSHIVALASPSWNSLSCFLLSSARWTRMQAVLYNLHCNFSLWHNTPRETNPNQTIPNQTKPLGVSNTFLLGG